MTSALRISAFSAAAASTTPALAHAGNHGGLDAWSMAIHFIAQPSHLALTIGGLASLAALTWALRRKPARAESRRRR